MEQDLTNPIKNHPHDYSKLNVGDTVTHKGVNRMGRKLYRVTAKHEYYFDCESPMKTHYSFTVGSYMCGETIKIPDPDSKHFYSRENRRAWSKLDDDPLKGTVF